MKRLGRQVENKFMKGGLVQKNKKKLEISERPQGKLDLTQLLNGYFMFNTF